MANVSARLLSTISGPQEGTYFHHPKHMHVKLPKDCTDEAMSAGANGEPPTKPQPTAMIFFLEKIRLAQICRELTDIVPMEFCKLTKIPYEQIINIDKKLIEFTSSVPFFFRLDAASREESKALETIYPMIPVWRYLVTTAAHSRRCKLHQRFLLRQSMDARYAYSRRAALESARAVIQVYGDITGFYSPTTLMARIGIAVHYTHLAIVVLVMDLCFNKGATDEEEVKADVRETLRIFEGIRDRSPLLSRSLSALNGILQKHNVDLGGTSGASSSNLSTEAYERAALDRTTPPTQDPVPNFYDSGFHFDPSFSDFWNTEMEGELELDSATWDTLFSALDSRAI